MILEHAETWPSCLVEYLDSQREVLIAHAQHEQEAMDVYLNPSGQHVPATLMRASPYTADYELVSRRVIELLQSTSLRGWHCTRLTEDEVFYIKEHGMQPPNLSILEKRIRRVQTSGLIDNRTAERLIAENQADDYNRKGMIWFCFFTPKSASQHGIERFFRRWGGEALYLFHENDPHTGELLRSIGSPCIVEADVPMSSFGKITYLGDRVINRYLRDHDFGKEWEHEDKARDIIPPANINRFVFHGSLEFVELTGCDAWDPPL